MSISDVFITAGITLTMAAGCAAAAGPECEQLKGLKADKLLGYLAADRADWQPRCALYAMTQIGVQQYTPAIGLLIRSLDYRLPDEVWKNPYGLGHLVDTATIYPAADALSLIGKPAVAALVTSIGSGDSSHLIREHAIYTLGLILRDYESETVVVLSRASRTASDPATAQRLSDAAKDAAAKCRPDLRNVCINALNVP